MPRYETDSWMAGYKAGWLRREESGSLPVADIDFPALMAAVSNVWPTEAVGGNFRRFQSGIPHKGIIKAIANEYTRIMKERKT